MNILIIRDIKTNQYTIGKLYVNGKYICDTLEDVDRGLRDYMSEEEILEKKIKCETAIPTGNYKITLNTISPSFSKKEYYRNFCDGYLPRILNVKGFEGILIHRGINCEHSCGCILVGHHQTDGILSNSMESFEELYKLLLTDKDNLNLEIK